MPGYASKRRFCKSASWKIRKWEEYAILYNFQSAVEQELCVTRNLYHMERWMIGFQKTCTRANSRAHFRWEGVSNESAGRTNNEQPSILSIQMKLSRDWRFLRMTFSSILSPSLPRWTSKRGKHSDIVSNKIKHVDIVVFDYNHINQHSDTRTHTSFVRYNERDRGSEVEQASGSWSIFIDSVSNS